MSNDFKKSCVIFNNKVEYIHIFYVHMHTHRGFMYTNNNIEKISELHGLAQSLKQLASAVMVSPPMPPGSTGQTLLKQIVIQE